MDVVEHVKEEIMIEACKEGRGCLEGGNQKQEEAVHDSKEEEFAQEGSGHTSATSVLPPEGGGEERHGTDESRCEVLGGKLEPKTETKKKRKLEGKSFPCDKCSLVSGSSANLKKHLMTHSGEKPFECHKCHKAFRQRHHLVDHWRTHSGERPFKCEECGRRFIQKSSLNLHKKRHLGIKPFKCSLCSYATYEKVHLTIHTRSHTGEKPYQCEKCGQTFSTATRLKFHHMIHSGERRYKCEECGVPFREKVTLQAHMAVHLNLRPFECEECGQEFSRLAGLSLHRKVHNNKDNYLYVYDKEANQCFKSALENASHSKAAVTEEPFQDPEATPSSDKNWETDSNDACTASLANAPEEGKRDVMRPGEQGVPITPPQHPPGLLSCISPQHNHSPASKVSSSSESDSQHKLKENLASNLSYSVEHNASEVPPDQVREALEKGTVLETHGDDGKGFFIVLPPSLKHQGIMVLSDSSTQHATPSYVSDSSMTLGDRGPAFDRDISPNILPQNVLEVHKTLYPAGGTEVQDCVVDSAQLEEEICSEDEGEMIHPCEAESVECIFNTDKTDDEVLETIEEQHPDGTSLLLWKDNSTNQLTNVTYIIEDGKEEPLVIHSQEEGVSELSDTASPTRGRKRRKIKGSKRILEPRGGGHDEAPRDCVAVRIKINSKKNKPKVQKARKLYNCEQCGKACKNSSNYITHLRTHSGERPYFCDICRMGFKQISHLKSHIRIHTGERPYTCELCHATFTQSSRLNSHKKSLHPNGKIEVRKKKEKYIPENRVKNFFCRYCNKTYIGECLKIDHMKIHRPLLPHRCKICNMPFKSKTSMQSHYLKHSDCKHVCEVCGVEVQSLEELSTHRAQEHDEKLSDADMADMCINVKIGEENGFVVLNPTMKDGLDDMLGIQLKRESFDEAGVCEVKQEVIHVTDVDGTAESEVMPTHLQDEKSLHDATHTSPGKDRDSNTEREEEEEGTNLLMDLKREPLSSAEDDDDFASKEGEMKEKKFITYTDMAGKKVWVCKVCDRSFAQSSNLYCHMRMHTGDKPYQCSVCRRAFRQITHLKDHMKRHTGVRPHKCGECGKCFTQRSAVRRHIRVLHGGNAEPLREPEDDPRNEIIDTLSSEFGLISQHVTLRDALLGKDTLQEDDEKLCKLPHKENTPHACSVCKKQFAQISGLAVHMRKCRKLRKDWKVAPTDSLSCECGESFLSVTHLLQHQGICNLRGREEGHLEDGVGEASMSGGKRGNDRRKVGYENDICTDSGKKSKHKTQPTSGNTLVTQNQFKCKECGEVLQGITSYKTHLQGHGDELYQVCMVCGEVFKRASALRYHQSMKHGRQDRRYKDYCPSGYIREHLQEEGVKIKSEVDPEESFSSVNDNKVEELVCDVEVNIHETFRKHDLKSSKRRALKSVHNMTEEDAENYKEFSEHSTENLETKSYICSVCEMGFTSSSRLQHHMSQQHQAQGDAAAAAAASTEGHTEKSTAKVNKVDMKPENLGKSWESEGGGSTAKPCSVSGSTNECLVSEDDGDGCTTTESSRKDTARQGDAEFYCTSCDKHLSDAGSCEEHMLSHAAEKPFQCEHCLRRFKRKPHLFNHYRKHAREECM